MTSDEVREIIWGQVLRTISDGVWVNTWSKIQNNLRVSARSPASDATSKNVWDQVLNTTWGNVLDNVWDNVSRNVALSIKTHIE